MKIVSDYGELSEEDEKVLKEYAEKEFKELDSNSEILTLPSGKNCIVFCDGRVFIEEEND